MKEDTEGPSNTELVVVQASENAISFAPNSGLFIALEMMMLTCYGCEAVNSSEKCNVANTHGSNEVRACWHMSSLISVEIKNFSIHSHHPLVLIVSYLWDSIYCGCALVKSCHQMAIVVFGSLLLQ